MTRRLGLAPIERTTVVEEIRGILQRMILEGELPPGSAVPSERQLCEELSVARTSVRESIQGLVSLGLVERRGNRMYVAEQLPEFSPRELDGQTVRVRELFEVRRIIEPSMIRLALNRATPRQREGIVQLAQQFEADLPIEEFRRLDRAFHGAVARACGNGLLTELYGKVLDALFESQEFTELLTAPTHAAVVEEIVKVAGQDHKDIAAVFESGDVEAGLEAVKRHLDTVEDRIISQLIAEQ